MLAAPVRLERCNRRQGINQRLNGIVAAYFAIALTPAAIIVTENY